jgi:hypothetical protein
MQPVTETNMFASVQPVSLLKARIDAVPVTELRLAIS